MSSSPTHVTPDKTTPIRLIFETDAIIPPVTGIGRYARELLMAFIGSPEIEDLRCFSRGRWQSPQSLAEEERTANGGGEDSDTQGTWRPRWARRIFRETGARLQLTLQRQLLSRYAKSHLYHSPNYRLTPYAGLKVVTFHDLSVLKFPHFHPESRLKILQPALEYAALHADHLITDSEWVRREIMEYFGLPEKKVSAVPLASSLDVNFVSQLDRNEYLRGLGLSPGAYFLFVSTLEPRKNVETLIRAFEKLPATVRGHYPLVLAGQLGWRSEHIARTLDRAVRHGQVLHLGFLSDQQLGFLYSGARAFVFPSLYEGFGLPVLEAQSFGVPVITSNSSCLPEVLADSAILIDPLDELRLMESMLELAEAESRREELAGKGRVNASRYSWRKTADSTIDIYRKVLMT